jgi:catechol 2,3-dioxygenase-like lactoylglutathione lyase family enzyme
VALDSHRGAIHHIDLTVASVERSAAFYECLLGAVGFRQAGKREHTLSFQSRFAAIDIHSARRATPHDRYAPGLHHLALHAESREQVDSAHARLLELGATVLDPPAVYEGPAYGPDYYAAFFADPDGLKLEVVHTSHWSPTGGSPGEGP